MAPKQGKDNSLLLTDAWIQISRGRLPQAWGFPLDARVRGDDVEIVDILQKCVFYVGHANELLMQLLEMHPPVLHRFFPRSANQLAKPLTVYFAHLGVGSLLFTAPLTARSL